MNSSFVFLPKVMTVSAISELFEPSIYALGEKTFTVQFVAEEQCFSQFQRCNRSFDHSGLSMNIVCPWFHGQKNFGRIIDSKSAEKAIFFLVEVILPLAVIEGRFDQSAC